MPPFPLGGAGEGRKGQERAGWQAVVVLPRVWRSRHLRLRQPWLVSWDTPGPLRVPCPQTYFLPNSPRIALQGGGLSYAGALPNLE